ncbi:MAG: hypothetical protein KAS48_02970 [Gammaproteobacteria bacterium]|nr:hypothetical protein [Gammaproteobacteria bacterium]MCK5091969.1 hypothetical protein [Gammaproteobacteria bacterium]
MKRIFMYCLMMLLTFPVWAHHTKEHTMLQEDPSEVIAATQQGISGPWVWLIWVGVIVLLVLGIWRWLKKGE